VSQIVLSDEAEVILAGWYNGDFYTNPPPTLGFWGKGAGAGHASRNHHRGGRGL